MSNLNRTLIVAFALIALVVLVLVVGFGLLDQAAELVSQVSLDLYDGLEDEVRRITTVDPLPIPQMEGIQAPIF